MSPFSDLVQDAKLSTKLDSEYTIHTFLESSLVSGRRSRRREREEKWKRKRHLGVGIFGTVWLEECAVNNETKLRAVKEIRKTGQGPKPIDYSRELEAIVKFSQQKFDGCFVKSSGWFENEESLFICMEYFVLGDLQKYMCQPFPEGEAQHVTLQILEGLDFMHSNGFDHRDLKPQNIFIIAKSPEWWVKIGDFGISKRVMEGLTGLQAFNSAPAFTAPELYKTMWEPSSSKEPSTSNFNPEVDIWSVGVISYYLLTGKLPFDGQHDLLAYYNKESELPTESLTECQSSDEALKFLKDILVPTPSDRLSARDALEHSWLAALLQESDPDEPVEPPIQPPIDEKIIPPLQPRRPRSSQDVMLPGTINLTGTQMMLGPGTPLTLPPPHNHQSYAHSLVEATQQELISQQQYHHLQLQQQQVMMTTSQTTDEQQSNIGTFGVNGDYKPPVSYTTDRISGLNLLSNVHPLHRPAADPETPYNESQITDSSRPAPLRQHSSQFTPLDMPTNETGIDTLPRYTRRRSDAAPIPISDLDLDLTDPRTETPSVSESRSRSSTIESPRGSIERQNSERRFSDRFRRVSGSMLPKRHNQRSVDHGKKKDKDKDKDSLKETSSDVLSGSSTASTITMGSDGKGSRRKTKSQFMEVPGRPQFAEGLPLFPVRVKKG